MGSRCETPAQAQRDRACPLLLVLHARMLPQRVGTILQMDRPLWIREANAMLIEGELDLFEEAEPDLADISPLHPHLHHHVDA